MNEITISEYIKKAENEILLLPDKPEETYENTVRALWLAAAGKPVSVIAANDEELPDLNDEMKKKIRCIIQRKIRRKTPCVYNRFSTIYGLRLLCQ